MDELLEDDSERAYWDVRLGSTIVLRQEGHTHISAAMVSQRVESFKSMCRILGIPDGGFRIVGLDHGIVQGIIHGPVSPHRLFAVDDENGRRIDVAVPDPPRARHPSAVDLYNLAKGAEDPLAPSVVPSLRNCIVLPGDDDEWASRRIHQFYGSQFVAGESVAASSVSQAIVPLNVPVTSKNGAKFTSLLRLLKKQMTPLEGTDWETKVKEGEMTPILTKLQALRTVAASQGDEEVVKQCDPISQSIVGWKAVLKIVRDLARCKEKISKLTLLLPPLTATLIFLRDTIRIIPAASMLLLSFKARLTQQGGDSADITVGLAMHFQDIVDDGLLSALRQELEDRENLPSFSPQMWLEDALRHGLSVCIQRAASNWQEELISFIANDFSVLTEKVEHCMYHDGGTFRGQAAERFTADLRSIQVAFAAHPDESNVSPSAVNSAFKHM